MAKSKKTSSRKARRMAQQEREKRQRWLVIGLVIVGLVIIVGLGFMIRQARTLKVEDIVLPESLEPLPNADGKAWGPSEAPVVIDDFSDFQ